jgi:two-component system, NtrC family, response regulator AtoC
MSARILIVEDEKTALHSLSVLLEDEGFTVLMAEDGETALGLALREEPDLVLLDIRLPGMDGLTLLQRLRAGYSDAAVIIMTADTASSTAIRATQLGAFDYMTKPVDIEHLLVLVRRALEYRALDREVRALRAGKAAGQPVAGMVGHSAPMQAVYKLIGRVASSDATVLIEGESGTGKELVANAIHDHSSRVNGPIVRVNCAAIPEPLLEAELFGHERGAFTNALYLRKGRFEEAEGGTLFLDEVGDLPLALQAKLLRAVQERTVERLGSNRPLKIDFRLIAATARHLSDAVAAGGFREDLYYRLNVVRIQLPALRERPEDIPLLVRRFLARSDRPVTLRPDALDLLLAYDWPGNVRELENVVARAMAIAPGGVITADCIEIPRRSATCPNAAGWIKTIPWRNGFKNVVNEVERYMLEAAVADAGGNKARAAQQLGIQRRLLYDKMREFGLE